MEASGDKRPHGCGYKLLDLSRIESGLCSLIYQSNLRLKIG
jgi:hypothetical protein